MKRLIVGLAGGVGSGKSTVARLFRNVKPSVRILDADVVGHRVRSRPAIRRALAAAFGPDILRGRGIDRRALAAAAFRSRTTVARLNRIVHPAILQEIRQATQRARGWLVLDASLLFETGIDALCDRTVFVDAPRAVRRRRAEARRGWPPGELERREKFQWRPARKRARADFVVDNGGSLARAERQVRNIVRDLEHPDRVL